MRPPSALSAIAVAFLVIPADAGAQDTISLRFDWPERTMARVEAQRVRAQLNQDRIDSMMVAISYTMRSEPHPEGRVVRYSGFQFEGLPAGWSGPPSSELDRVMSLVPSVIVSDAGEFLRLEDAALLRAHFDSLLAPMLRDLPAGERGEQALAAIQSMISDESLAAFAADEWNTLVAQWIDADLELGEDYMYESDAPFPLVPGTVIPYENEFSITRRVPCLENGMAEDCVEIVMYSTPNSEAVAEVLERFLRQIGELGDAEPPTFRDLIIESTVTLVVEPGTLLPHRATIARQVSGSALAEGEEEDFYQLDLRSWSYSYVR